MRLQRIVLHHILQVINRLIELTLIEVIPS